MITVDSTDGVRLAVHELGPLRPGRHAAPPLPRHRVPRTGVAGARRRAPGPALPRPRLPGLRRLDRAGGRARPGTASARTCWRWSRRWSSDRCRRSATPRAARRSSSPSRPDRGRSSAPCASSPSCSRRWRASEVRTTWPRSPSGGARSSLLRRGHRQLRGQAAARVAAPGRRCDDYVRHGFAQQADGRHPAEGPADTSPRRTRPVPATTPSPTSARSPARCSSRTAAIRRDRPSWRR